MIEEEFELRTADGTPEAVLFRPDDTRRWPGVLHLTDIGGIRDAQRDMARRLAAAGYAVLMPNVFYRTGRPPLFSFKITAADERTMKRVAELGGPLTPEAIARDAGAYVDALAARAFVADGPMGVVGYCFTGAMALRVAAARPDRIAAAASFHGGRLFTDAPTSPHLALPEIRARLYFGHATADRSMPAAAIEGLDQALRGWGGRFESEVYDGALHSWTVPDSPVYNAPQAERAFEKLTALFAAEIGEARVRS
jgi:carboxymethylenebutenolidase